MQSAERYETLRGWDSGEGRARGGGGEGAGRRHRGQRDRRPLEEGELAVAAARPSFPAVTAPLGQGRARRGAAWSSWPAGGDGPTLWGSAPRCRLAIMSGRDGDSSMGENVPRRSFIVASVSGVPLKRRSTPRRRPAILASGGGDPRTRRSSSRRRLVILADGGDCPISQGSVTRRRLVS